MLVCSIVVAAGSGARFGGPKQLALLAGRRVLDWSLDLATEVSNHVVIVVPAELVDSISPSIDSSIRVVAGGATRSESVRSGLDAVPDDAAVIVVHDGARPLADVGIFDRVIDAVRSGADAAIPVVPVSDTIRHVDGGVVDRSTLVAVQTPQAFAASALRRAHGAQAEATDDAGLVEAAGGTVVHVPGTPENLKITNPSDLAMAEAILGERTEEHSDD